MGVFFKQATVPRDRVRRMLTHAYTAESTSPDEAAARAESDTADAATDTAINVGAFVAAGIVFLVLLVATFLTAQQADAQAGTYMKDLAGLLQTLLTAWSAAVLGLIGGEAVGSRAS